MLTIVGNGPSRLKYNLNELDTWWGCNAIFDDYVPDLLFAGDIKMQNHVIKSEYYKNNKLAVGGWEPLDISMKEMMMSGFEYSHDTVNDFTEESDDRFIIQGNNEYVDFLGYRSDYEHNIIMYNFHNLKNLFTGMMALGYAAETGHKEVTLLGFDALQTGDVSNVYEGRLNYLSKYTKESRVFDAQRSQFIALLKHYDIEVFFKNPLDENAKVEYNRLYDGTNYKEWILGLGFADGTV